MPLASPLIRNTSAQRQPEALLRRRAGTQAAGPCHMVMPTLIVEFAATSATHLVEKFRTMGISDVDVVNDVDAALSCFGEREYAIVVLRQDVAGQANTALLVRFAMAFHPSDQPAILLFGKADVSIPDLPEVTRLDPECNDADFAEAVRAAIATSGAQCRSIPYCRRTPCPLGPGAEPPQS
jgi:hypothetical protein